jgi:hypothetical protein
MLSSSRFSVNSANWNQIIIMGTISKITRFDRHDIVAASLWKSLPEFTMEGSKI